MKFSIQRLLPKSLFVKNVISIASGTVLGQAIVFICSPVLTRLYSPEDFGVFAVFTSMLAILAVIGAMRYELAIPLAKDDQSAADLLVLSLIIAFIISCLTGLIIWAFGYQIIGWTKTPALKLYIWLLPVGIFGASSYTIFNYWAIRKNNYFQIGKTKTVQGIMLTVTQIVVGALKKDPFGLLLGQVVGHTAGMTSLASQALRKNSHNFKNVTVSGMISVAVRFRRFPLISSYSSLLDSLGAHAPAFLFAAFYGPTVAGWFALSQRVIGAPLSIIGNSIAQVFLGEASKIVKKDETKLQSLYIKSVIKLFLIGLIILTPVGLFAPWLFKTIFGDVWFEAGRFAQVLTPMMIMQFVVSPLSQTLNVLERQDLQLFWVVIWVTSIVGGLGLAQFLDFSALLAVIICSAATSVSYLIHLGLCLYVLKSRCQKHAAT